MDFNCTALTVFLSLVAALAARRFRGLFIEYFPIEKIYMNRLSGKVIVITGASSGAGRAMAVTLAKEGAKLVLAARREAALDEVAEECRIYNAEVTSVVTDVKEMSDVYALAKKAAKDFGGIDVWINNAGVLAAGEMDKIPADVNEDVIRTNLLGYVHGAQAALPFFKEQRSGILINNISVGGWIATPYMAAYSASKFGLRGFFEALKGELLHYPNIHVCDLYPGFLDTPGIQHAANYTGKHLRPAPPVYDPQRVADAVVKLILNPKPKKSIGSSSVILKTAFALFPSLSRNITAHVIRTYLKNAEESESTAGNILTPVDYGTSVSGGWQTAMTKPKLQNTAFAIAALAVAGSILLTRNK
jgi:short-subunit dehydrogenase